MPECIVTAVTSRVRMEVVYASLWLMITANEREDIFLRRSTFLAFPQLAGLASATGRPEPCTGSRKTWQTSLGFHRPTDNLVCLADWFPMLTSKCGKACCPSAEGSALSRELVFLAVDSYLVDPASSHMLVSKIKPCMSKYKHLYCETANGSLNQLSFI